MAPSTMSTKLETFCLRRTELNSHNVIPKDIEITQPPSCNTTSCSFLGLPAEIRHQIYTDIFTVEQTDARVLNRGPNSKLHVLLVCRQTYCEARTIAFATQPAFLDMWAYSWDMLLHTPLKKGVSKGCMIGSARVHEKLSQSMPVENIKRLVIRYFDWDSDSTAKFNFSPISREVLHRLKPEEVYLYGYCCGNSATHSQHVKFMSALPFLAKIFSNTSHFVADMCMDRCWVGYGFETVVSWAHYSSEIVSGGMQDGWELTSTEHLGYEGIKFTYTILNNDAESSRTARSVVFEMSLRMPDGDIGCVAGPGKVA